VITIICIIYVNDLLKKFMNLTFFYQLNQFIMSIIIESIFSTIILAI